MGGRAQWFRGIREGDGGMYDQIQNCQKYITKIIFKMTKKNVS